MPGHSQLIRIDRDLAILLRARPVLRRNNAILSFRLDQPIPGIRDSLLAGRDTLTAPRRARTATVSGGVRPLRTNPPHLPSPDASTVVNDCRQRGLFLRDAALMGSQLGTHVLRIAVKDAMTNRRMVSVLREMLELRTPPVSTLSVAW